MLKQPVQTGELESYSAEVQSNTELGGANPFPGLRPFSIDDCHLFFGREGQVDEILVKLSENRFVTVMGYSGSGKSSLMYCGLVPVLYGGFMTHSGPHWNVIITRPGSSPIANLTDSVVEFLIHTKRIDTADKEVHKAIIGSVLRSGPDGLIEVARHLQSQKNENVFFLVDQFEELLRFREAGDLEQGHDEAQLYVNLILQAVNQTRIPVHTALTMRSDFIGNCSVFPGLTQLINDSNYLVPQMTREQKKMAIEGPIAVAGGKISKRLIKRLLSDIGNDQDQLPILQHVLMRSWDYWVDNHEPGEPIDIRHYNAVGKITEALSQHANEAYDELTSREKEIAEVLFKNVTEKTQENRGMRRACQLGLIAELAEASEQDVINVVEQFRKAGRSFLMPAANIPLHGDSMLELSHESLMRIWNRLDNWVEEEFDSAQTYKRLSEAAAMYQIGRTGLWRPPDLQLALNWQKKQQPTREWAQRYDEAFERAIVFLDTSRITYEAELKNQEMLQRRVLRRTRATAIILGIAAVIAILFFVYAYIQKIEADQQKIEADVNRIKAEQQTKIAEENKEKAEQQTKIAIQKGKELEAAYKTVQETLVRLEYALADARKARDEARASAIFANEQRDTAQVQKVKAQREYIRAESALEKANRLYMLTIAQTLATKSVQEDDDKNLAGLLAMQGYHYHRRYAGKQYDPYIYRGLYSALTKLSGSAYNALKLQGPPHVYIKSLAVAGKNNSFYASGADGRILLGNYEKLTNTPTEFSTPYPSKVIALSKDENYLLNGSDSSFVQIYDVRSGRNNPVVLKGFNGSTNDIEALPNGSGFIVSSSDKTLSFVDHLAGTTKQLVVLPYELKSISISPDGKWLAGGAWTGQVILVNLQDNSYSVLAEDAMNRVLAVRFSPDGNSLAYGIELLDPANRRGLVRLYNFKTKETRPFTGHRAGVYDVEFSPDGKLLASAGLDKRIQMWVLDNPEDLPIEMENNNGFVWDIAFARGSDYLIAACSESEIRVWPTDPALLATKICPELKRNMTQDEWKKYVGDDIKFETTCVVGAVIKDY